MDLGWLVFPMAIVLAIGIGTIVDMRRKARLKAQKRYMSNYGDSGSTEYSGSHYSKGDGGGGRSSSSKNSDGDNSGSDGGGDGGGGGGGD